MEEQTTKQNNITISDDVVATIVGLAVSEVEGVAEMSAGLTDGIYDLIGRKNPAKGIRIETKDRDVTVDISLIVEYGVKIPEVALKVQEAVKNNIETMTGLHPVSINVHVQGLKAEKEEPAAAPAAEPEAPQTEQTEEETTTVAE